MFSYAQNKEDVLLARILGRVKNGFYVDVGANDPTHHSVTRHFYDHGWNGINIEASPYWFQRIVNERPRDINLNLAASDTRGVLTFHELVGTGLSTSLENFAARGEDKGFERRTYEVQTDTLDSILAKYAAGRDIHFLKIDVEGAEPSVLAGVDLSLHRPWVVLVEATEPLSAVTTHHSWEHFLVGAGYEFMLFDNLNRWYVPAERTDLKPLLSSPADDYEPVETFWTRGHLENRVRELERRYADSTHKTALERIKNLIKAGLGRT